MNAPENTSNQDNQLDRLIDRVIDEEKRVTADSFLVERVMAGIQVEDKTTVIVRGRVLEIFAYAASLALVIFTGINIGTYAGKQLTERSEIVLLNDAHIERIELLMDKE